MTGILWIIISITVNNTCLQLFLSSSIISFSRRHINLSPTGFNWYKSPTAIRLKPPNTAFVPVSCCKCVSIMFSVRLLTIVISSIITTLRCLYFILNVFNSSADRRFVPWYIFLRNAEQIV